MPSFIREGGRPVPDSVHAGDCRMTSRNTRPVTATEARRLLADGHADACMVCRADSELGNPRLTAALKAADRPAPSTMRAGPSPDSGPCGLGETAGPGSDPNPSTPMCPRSWPPCTPSGAGSERPACLGCETGGLSQSTVASSPWNPTCR
ncbi:DUF6233 domain-containing protein [Streptomyces sp. NPDC051921]|uniref:DUF6233 domain-containing protein n=1 Tax=Streptomyces sp. NPDC051921 TaxID=3155806 RepID=UPI003412331E